MSNLKIVLHVIFDEIWKHNYNEMKVTITSTHFKLLLKAMSKKYSARKIQ